MKGIYKAKITRFKHNYFKLKYNIYTTLRGRTNNKYNNELTTVMVGGKDDHFSLVRYTELLIIKNIPLKALKYDGEYENFIIKSHQEFVDLLNSFYPRSQFPSRKAHQETILKLLVLEKLNCDNCCYYQTIDCKKKKEEPNLYYCHSYFLEKKKKETDITRYQKLFER